MDDAVLGLRGLPGEGRRGPQGRVALGFRGIAKGVRNRLDTSRLAGVAKRLRKSSVIASGVGVGVECGAVAKWVRFVRALFQ